MRVKVIMPTADSQRLREKIVEGAEKIEDDEIGGEEWTVVRLFNSPGMPFPTVL
jgi:ribosome maturation protein SDO1